MENEDEEGLRPCEFSDSEDNNTVHDIDGRLLGMRNCYNLIRKHGADLQQALSEFEAKTGESNETMLKLSQLISEKGSLLGIAAKAMLFSCDSYINSAESDANKLIKSLQFEKARTVELERMIHDVAKEQLYLERKTKRLSRLFKITEFTEEMRDDSEEQSFEKEPQETTQRQLVEADSLTLIRKSVKSNFPFIQFRNNKIATSIERQKERRKEKKMEKQSRKKENNQEEEPQLDNEKQQGYKEELPEQIPIVRRSRVPDRPHIPFSAWSVLKNSIGKDLSKIPMPVYFNEPITILQRITEELEYSKLLDFAANIDDTCEQLAYVAAFSISVYAPTAIRTNKPFNPLLGETYECDRTDDLGWRSISEQVSHHPPISALYCEGRGWTFWQDMGLVTKFRGKTIQFRPTGNCNCKFHKTGNTYTWNKPTTLIHNIFIGKMWMDQQGPVNIVGLDKATGVTCELTYIPLSYFSSETLRQVNGVVKDQNGVAKWLIKGLWDEQAQIASIKSVSNTKNEAKYETDDFRLVWKKNEIDPESENYHNFSKFTCELNELEPGVSPTDSRLRPDVRLMEDGLWDESNAEKLRIEQKQRNKRKSTVGGAPTDDHYEPVWFSCEIINNHVNYKYKGTYWDAKQKQDWSRCPDIF